MSFNYCSFPSLPGVGSESCEQAVVIRLTSRGHQRFGSEAGFRCHPSGNGQPPLAFVLRSSGGDSAVRSAHIPSLEHTLLFRHGRKIVAKAGAAGRDHIHLPHLHLPCYQGAWSSPPRLHAGWGMGRVSWFAVGACPGP